MRDLRLLLLSGVGVAGVVAVAACATEAQEPGVNGIGPTSGLTSDSSSDTGTDTETSTSTSTSAGTQAVVTSGPVTTTTNTTGDSDDGASTETATTTPLPLGGTITDTSAASTTGNEATTSNVTTSSQTTASATSATTATSGGPTSGNGGMGGMTSIGGFTATTGNGSCSPAPATGPVPLEANDGWVDCSSNDVGIQGEFFTYSDGNGSTITSSFTGDEICVEGTAGQVVSDNSVWGAGLGVNLNQEEPEADLDTWNANAMGISGFRFALSALPPSGLRLVYQSGGTDYCVEVTSAAAQTVLFEDTAEACWGSGGDAPNPATLEAVKWQITTNSAEHDFSFCITQLAAVP